MRIPLDYYRILGLTSQATFEQIQLTHRDRVLSMPRREYSDAAIASRKRIIDSAYALLSDPARRRDYDASVALELEEQAADPEQKTERSDSVSTELEIEDQDLPGLLLLLHELGEYEQVLTIAQPYYDPDAISFQSVRVSRDPDVTLTVALSYLEVGRENWKQGQYESAAQSLESGQELLLREGLFLSVRSEIQADLFRLRPYRILELLAAPDSKVAEHRQGMLLLQEMLEARRGIDGTGNDSSGLGIDDFLRFIQQLRGYMTAAEQQTLFEDEARRPSSVASYLAVYALIARGFSQRQPALIRRAKGLLVKLSVKQDIYLEQAVCALLLGQTEEASNALEKSGEREQIAFIRRNSEDSPDLLPGLCLYSERWLQEEVYPHFRDLINQVVSLKDYFADDQVQSYLEELPNTNGLGNSDWVMPSFSSRITTTASPDLGNDSENEYVSPLNGRSETKVGFREGARFETPPERRIESKVPAYTAERTSRLGRTSLLDRPTSDLDRKTSTHSNTRTLPPLPKPRENARQGLRESAKDHKKSSPSRSRRVKPQRFILLLLIVFGLMGGLISLSVWAWKSLTSPPKAESVVSMERSLAPLLTSAKSEGLTVTAKPGPMDKDIAIKLIESWQATKSKALGNAYDTEALTSILTEPVLSDWKSRAKELKSSNSYLQYISKPAEVVKVTPDGDDRARVTAKVSETRNYFNNGNLDASASKSDTSYLVEYDFVRKDDKWLIRDMLVSE
ncbi:IMS domain-containing protein [Tumidithrix elongata RA019]|uniref:IMS domain-containing protein n=1 Tax=Tumidithrix elongata BACA0141 TaxID=2716417 RepID=A0AAW9Q276_9CYAN|nr:IMS domain-containing protein [Tumidithrix elongata RA019]